MAELDLINSKASVRRDRIAEDENLAQASLRYASAQLKRQQRRERQRARRLAAQAPVVAPSAPQVPVYSGDVVEIIHQAAAEFGLSGNWLVSIAHCESTLNPQAVNPAGYYGLFQYDESTWAANGYGSIFDPVAQARTTARLLAAGQSSRWPNCA